MIGTANEALFIELHKLRRQEKPEEGADASIRFIEPASIKFFIIGCYIEVDLLLSEDWIGGHVGVLLEVLRLDVEKLLNIVDCFAWL